MKAIIIYFFLHLFMFSKITKNLKIKKNGNCWGTILKEKDNQLDGKSYDFQVILGDDQKNDDFTNFIGSLRELGIVTKEEINSFDGLIEFLIKSEQPYRLTTFKKKFYLFVLVNVNIVVIGTYDSDNNISLLTNSIISKISTVQKINEEVDPFEIIWEWQKILTNKKIENIKAESNDPKKTFPVNKETYIPFLCPPNSFYTRLERNVYNYEKMDFDKPETGGLCLNSILYSLSPNSKLSKLLKEEQNEQINDTFLSLGEWIRQYEGCFQIYNDGKKINYIFHKYDSITILKIYGIVETTEKEYQSFFERFQRFFVNKLPINQQITFRAYKPKQQDKISIDELIKEKGNMIKKIQDSINTNTPSSTTEGILEPNIEIDFYDSRLLPDWKKITTYNFNFDFSGNMVLKDFKKSNKAWFDKFIINRILDLKLLVEETINAQYEEKLNNGKYILIIYGKNNNQDFIMVIIKLTIPKVKELLIRRNNILKFIGVNIYLINSLEIKFDANEDSVFPTKINLRNPTVETRKGTKKRK